MPTHPGADASAAPVNSRRDPTFARRSAANRTRRSSEGLPRTGVARAAIVLTYLSAFTTPWNGMRTAGLRPGDLFMLLAIMVFFPVGIASATTTAATPPP